MSVGNSVGFLQFSGSVCIYIYMIVRRIFVDKKGKKLYWDYNIILFLCLIDSNIILFLCLIDSKYRIKILFT